MNLPGVVKGCGWCVLAWALLAQAGGVPAQAAGAGRGGGTDSSLDKSVGMFVHITGQHATSLGVHTATVRNVNLAPLLIVPRSLEDRPGRGNGIDVSPAPFRLEAGQQQDLRYTVRTNESPGSSPFTMTRAFALDVSMEHDPRRKAVVPLVLSATLDPAQLVQVTVPTVGAAGSYVCAAAELERTPQASWPVHCRNTLPDAQAGSFPLDLYVAAADPARVAYMRPLDLGQLYRTRYVDGSTEPLNCPHSCTIDFAGGRQSFGYSPTKPLLGHALEALLPGLPRIGRRMLGDEPDVVLEVERRPDLMDPTTRVDTVHAACIGDACGADAIVIDAVERIDDVGRGFDTPSGDEMPRYAPDGELRGGMTLLPGGRRARAEVVWRITEASKGTYVESHYEIRYHGRDGRPRRHVSPRFGGILEPAVGRALSARRVGGDGLPPWAREQLYGPFLRLDLPDATMTTRSVPWATPPLDSRMRLPVALVTGETGSLGSATLVGMPQLRPDDSIEQFKALSALHVLIPLFHNGLSVSEYLGLYDAAIELTLSEDWIHHEPGVSIDTPDPTAALLPHPQILGRTFHSLRNAVIQISAPQLPSIPDVHLPDVIMYTVHPTEPVRLSRKAIDAAPLLQFSLSLEPSTPTGPISMLGFPAGAKYQVVPPGSTPVEFLPLIHSGFPALRSRVSSEVHVPFNTRELLLGTGERFLYTLLNPLSGEEVASGNDAWIFRGLSGAGVLSHLEWAGDGSLTRAVVHGVQSSNSTEAATGELRLLYTGLDVAPTDQRGLDYRMWLLSHIW